MIRSSAPPEKTNDAGRIGTLADVMGNMPEFVAKMHLVLKGEFAEEIARLKAEQALLAEKHGIIDTLEKAAKVRADADAYALDVTRQANERHAQAQDEFKRAAEERSNARQWLADLTKKEAAFGAQQQARRGELEARDAELATREQAHARKAADLVAREADFAKRVQDYHRSVEAMEARAARIKAALEG